MWEGAPPLTRASCPSCGRGLVRTSHQLQLPVRYARGRGRRKQLEPLPFYELLRVDPGAAHQDVERRIANHIARCHPAGPAGQLEPGCAACRLLGQELRRAYVEGAPHGLAGLLDRLVRCPECGLLVNGAAKPPQCAKGHEYHAPAAP